MILAAVLALQAAAATPVPPAPPSSQDDVVVVGRRNAAEAALAECLAGTCPPRRDVALSLALAQEQFAAGDYAGSRRTLRSARGRNKGHAAELPLEVAGLHRANARSSSQNGLLYEARFGLFDAVEALKKGLGSRSEQVLLARIDLGVQLARAGRFPTALARYADVGRAARREGYAAVEGLALFQRAALLAAMAADSRSIAPSARRAAAELDVPDRPEWLPFRNALRVVPVLLAPEKERPALVDRALSGMEPQSPDAPQLLYDPGIDLGSAAGLPGDATEWMDLGYTVAADGRVGDVRLLRRSRQVSDALVEAASKGLSGRRYAPLALPPGASPPRRVDRVSLVSDLPLGLSGTGGSRIVRRASERRVEVQELGKGLDER